MAGLGWKQWVRERLSADHLQGYIQDQVVTVWPSRAARTAGLTSPSEGMVSYLLDENALEVYRAGAWHDPTQTLVALFSSGTAGTSAQATALRLTGTMNGTCHLESGRVYRAQWRAGFMHNTAGQGTVAEVRISNSGATPAAGDNMVATGSQIMPYAQQAIQFECSGLFRVATSKSYSFSPWLRRAAISGHTGTATADTLTPSGTQWIQIEDLGDYATMVARISLNPGTIPLITI